MEKYKYQQYIFRGNKKEFTDNMHMWPNFVLVKSMSHFVIVQLMS